MSTPLPTNSSSNSVNLLTALSPILLGSGKASSAETGGLSGNTLGSLTSQLTNGKYSAGQATADTNNAVNNALKMAFQSFVPKIGASQTQAGVYNSSQTNQQMSQDIGNASAAAGALTAQQIAAYQQNQNQLAGVLSNNSKTGTSITSPSINPTQLLMGLGGAVVGNAAIGAAGKATGLGGVDLSSVLTGDLSSLPTWAGGSGATPSLASSAFSAAPSTVGSSVLPTASTLIPSATSDLAATAPIAAGTDLTGAAAGSGIVDANTALAATAQAGLTSSAGAATVGAAGTGAAVDTGIGAALSTGADTAGAALGSAASATGAGIADAAGAVSTAAADAGGAIAGTAAADAGAAGGAGIMDMLAPVIALWIVCTELKDQGKLNIRLWAKGLAYFKEHYDADAQRAYHLWAKPAVKHMKKYPSGKLCKLMEMLFVPRAEWISGHKTIAGFTGFYSVELFTWLVAVISLNKAAITHPVKSIKSIKSIKVWLKGVLHGGF
jgi:hypothetical protein